MFTVSASGGQKPQFWANFDIFGGSCTEPLLPMRAKFGEQTHGTRLPAKFRLDRFILSPSGSEKPPIFANFSDFLDFGNKGQIWCDRADPRSTLTGLISSECVHCVGFWWPKNPQFFCKF